MSQFLVTFQKFISHFATKQHKQRGMDFNPDRASEGVDAARFLADDSCLVAMQDKKKEEAPVLWLYKSCRVAPFSAQQAASSPIISGPIISRQKIFQQISPIPFIPLQLIASVLQSPIMDSIPSASPSWCFPFHTGCTLQWSFNWEMGQK